MKFLGIDFDYYFENYPDANGYFGKYGGCKNELPQNILEDMAKSYKEMLVSEEFKTMQERIRRFRNSVPSPFVLLKEFSNENVKIYAKLKRPNNLGANPCMGQGFLARFMDKERIVASAEDGVAAVMSSSVGRIPCEVFVNPKISGNMFVLKLKVMGGTVIETDGDPREEAIKAATEDSENTLLFQGTATGSHPYPTIIRDFSKQIGDETFKQYFELETELPKAVITAAGKGESSVGFISGFTNIFTDIVAVSPEAQIPELMFLNDLERIRFAEVNEDDAARAAEKLLKLENIKTDAQSAKAFAYAVEYAKKLDKGNIIVNL